MIDKLLSLTDRGLGLGLGLGIKSLASASAAKSLALALASAIKSLASAVKSLALASAVKSLAVALASAVKSLITTLVLNKAGVKRELLDIVKARKLAYCGHTMRKQVNCLEKEMMQGTMSGACREGRPHIDNIKTWTGLHVEESIRMTEELRG